MDISLPFIGGSAQRQAARAKSAYDSTIIGLLRAVTIKIDDLQDSLSQMKAAGALQDTQARDQEVNRVVVSEFWIYQANQVNIEADLKRLSEILDGTAEQNQDCRGTIDKLGTLWRRATGQWPVPPAEGAAPNTTADTLTKVTQAFRYLDEIRYEIAIITFPSRLTTQLDAVGIGTQIDFTQLDFLGGELPLSADLQQQIFQYLRDHPQTIRNGRITQGTLVIRVEENPLVQMRSAALVIALLFLGGLIIWIACTLPPAWLSSLPFASQLTVDNRFALLTLYTIIFLGACVHIIIDFVKQGSQAGAGGVLNGSLALWIHMHEGEMLRWAIYIIITFWVLMFLPDDSSLRISTAFFIGYTMDSIVDVSLQRFGKTAAAQQETIQKALGSL